LVVYTNEDDVYLYPVNELITSEAAVASPEMRSERMSTLSAILNNEAKIIIAPVAALKRLLPPKNIWKQYQLTFIEGDAINLPQYLDNYVTLGYRRDPTVTAPAEFSFRRVNIDI